MASIGDLIAYLRLDTSGWDKGAAALKKNVLSLGSFDKSLRLEGIAKAGLMLGTAINAASIATKVLSKDFVAAYDAIEKLPLGVGQIAKTLKDVIGGWSGVTAEIERANAATKGMEASTKAISDAMSRAQAARAEFRSGARSARQEAALVGKSGSYADIIAEQQRIGNRRREIQDSLNKARRDVGSKFSEAMRSQSFDPTDEDVYREMQRRGLHPTPLGFGSGLGDFAKGISGQKAEIRSSLAAQNRARASSQMQRTSLETIGGIESEAKKNLASEDALSKTKILNAQKELWKGVGAELGKQLSGVGGALGGIAKRVTGSSIVSGTRQTLFGPDGETNWERQQRIKKAAEADLKVATTIDKGSAKAMQLEAGAFSFAGAAQASRTAAERRVEIGGEALTVLKQILEAARNPKPAAAA